MTLCTEFNFDILLTIDKNLMFQQNLHQYNITIVVFNTLTSKLEELLLHLPSFNAAINSLKKHKAYIIDK